MQIRIGTRNSKLALIQTQIVIEEIKNHFPEIDTVIIPIVTTGDRIIDKNLYDIGGKALFLKEIEEQLLDNKIDIAVHSLKDVPGILPTGLEIVAFMERSSPHDCLVCFKGFNSLDTLPSGAKIGTSSVRRKIIINNMRPDLEVVQFRGNVPTRMQKLEAGEVDAAILACAGLKRTGIFDNSYCFPIDAKLMLPAAGQGIIAIETCCDNKSMKAICDKINHKETAIAAGLERSFLAYLNASCRTPIAVYAEVNFDIVRAKYMLASIDGAQIEFLESECTIDKAEAIGIEYAKKMKSLFADYEKSVLGAPVIYR